MHFGSTRIRNRAVGTMIAGIQEIFERILLFALKIFAIIVRVCTVNDLREIDEIALCRPIRGVF